MLDIKVIREQPDFVRERLAARGAGDDTKIGELLSLDEKRRKLLAESEHLKSLRNRASKEIGALMGQKKFEDAEKKKVETKEIGVRLPELDAQVAETEAAREEILLRLPNLPN